jgi:hypothetical protein
MATLSQQIITDKSDRFNNLKTKRETWDKVEQLFHGMLNDAVSAGAKSQVFDPRMASLIIERAYRVMSQHSMGKVVGISNNDKGDVILKNLLLEKYVIPNANSQFDLLTKFRMVDLYSNVYGSFDVLVDMVAKKNGYVGPDMWLTNKRDIFLPVGAISYADADDVIVRTWRPISFFENLAKDKNFKNINQIIAKLEKKAGEKTKRDTENVEKRVEDKYPDQAPDGYYEILTRYERDRWVDVCTDADMEFRDQKNPHEDDDLPLVRKYSLPLLEDPDGLGDAERGASMQMVQNSMWNLALDGVKISMSPPILVNKDNIASMSSIQWGAGKKWMVRGNIQNAIQPLALNPRGIDNFNNFFQAANASLLNVFGTSDTTLSQQQDNSMGKTPQALKMQQARENTRDNADKFYMEQFVSAVMKKMVNLLNKKQSSSVAVRMFPEEVDQIARDYPEIEDNYNKDKGQLTIPKGKKSNLYDYEIVTGSTFAKDDQMQQDNLVNLMTMYTQAQTPQGNTLVADLEKAGFTLKFGELYKRFIIGTGIKDWQKILEEKTPEEMATTELDKSAQIFQQTMQQMQMGGNVGGVPPMPGQPQQPQLQAQAPGFGAVPNQQ